MKVVCPSCNSTYSLPDHKIPARRSVATCNKCGGKIVFEPGAGLVPEPSSSPAASVTPPAARGFAPDPSALSSSFERAGKAVPAVSEMSNADESAARAVLADYPELQGLDIHKCRLGEILSPNKDGSFKNRKNKLKVKVLAAVESVFGRVLKKDELVLRIGRGTAYYPAEMLFGNGVLTTFYNQYAIVCTNQRILLINVSARLKRPTHYLFQLFYEEIKKIGRGPFRNALVLDRYKGKRRMLTNVGRYHSNELKQFILDRKTSAEPLSGSVYEDLCPACCVPLEKGLSSCPSCQAGFSIPKKAFLKSLVLPGWGDLYLGHRALGVLELLGSLFVWTMVASMIISQEPGKMITAAVLLVLYNGIDGLLTYHMAKKGYMLERA